MSYAGRSKYDEPGRAARYRDRSARRDAEEWALVAALLATIPSLDGGPPARTFLDVPCGTGRITERLLASHEDVRVACADLSPAMRAAAGERLGEDPRVGGIEALDLEAPGNSALQPAEVVVCLRFLHHLPSADHRRRVLASLQGLATRFVLVSFHHPVSAHNVARGLRRCVGGPRGDRYTLRPARLRAEAAAVGLGTRVARFRPLARWRREFWLALFDARAAPGSGPA